MDLERAFAKFETRHTAEHRPTASVTALEPHSCKLRADPYHDDGEPFIEPYIESLAGWRLVVTWAVGAIVGWAVLAGAVILTYELIVALEKVIP